MVQPLLNISPVAPSHSPKETLATMYDLPSEDPEEPGLPDDFHYYQPQLLRENIVINILYLSNKGLQPLVIRTIA